MRAAWKSEPLRLSQIEEDLRKPFFMSMFRQILSATHAHFFMAYEETELTKISQVVIVVLMRLS
jgi:hypothetical protein